MQAGIFTSFQSPRQNVSPSRLDFCFFYITCPHVFSRKVVNCAGLCLLPRHHSIPLPLYTASNTSNFDLAIFLLIDAQNGVCSLQETSHAVVQWLQRLSNSRWRKYQSPILQYHLPKGRLAKSQANLSSPQRSTTSLSCCINSSTIVVHVQGDNMACLRN